MAVGGTEWRLARAVTQSPNTALAKARSTKAARPIEAVSRDSVRIGLDRSPGVNSQPGPSLSSAHVSHTTFLIHPVRLPQSSVSALIRCLLPFGAKRTYMFPVICAIVWRALARIVTVRSAPRATASLTDLYSLLLACSILIHISSVRPVKRSYH